MNISDSVSELIAPMILYPQVLKIEESVSLMGVRSIIIRVASDDIKKIIGNGGRNFRSIRTLIRSALRDFNTEVIVDIVSGDY